MLRSIVACACVAVLLVAWQTRLPAAVAEEEPAAADATVYEANDEDADDRVEAIEDALASPVELKFVGTPLREVCQFIADLKRIRVVLDERRLEEAGISPDHSITFRIQGITLESALRLMLRREGMCHTVADEVLLITNQEDAGDLLSSKVYPVADLLPPAEDDVPGDEYEELTQMICSVVDPHSWDEVGGMGVIQTHRASRSLVCSQTRAVHQKIARLLDNLRETRAEHQEIARPATDPEKLTLRIYRLPMHTPAAEGDGKMKVADTKDLDSLAEQYVEAITITIAPDSWQDAGGRGTVAAVRGALFVRQTTAVHNLIRSAFKAVAPPTKPFVIGAGGSYFSVP